MRVGNLALALSLAVIVSCGGEAGSSDTPARAAARSAGLSEEQLEKGIGPVKDVELESLDPALAARGEEVFTLKCSACHKPDERYVGPALADVTTRRTPEFVMNMILNPAEMVEKHPEARKLLAEFMTPMPDQNLTEDDARAVLEYLRSLTASTDESMED